MEDASHPSCDWKWAFFGHQQQSNPLICFNATQASNMLDVAEPVPALGVPLEEQQEKIHVPEGGQARSCGWPQWPPPGRTRATTGSTGDDQIRQNQVQGPSWKSSQKQQKMGLETKLPRTHISVSTQKMRLETGAAQAWAEMLPQIHGQWVQGWGWLEQLGPFSSSGPWQLHRGKCKQKCPRERNQGTWENSFRALRFLQARMK